MSTDEEVKTAKARRLESLEDYRRLTSDDSRKSQDQFDKAIMTLSAGGITVTLALLDKVVPFVGAHLKIALFVVWTCWAASLTSTLVSFFFSTKALFRAEAQLIKEYKLVRKADDWERGREFVAHLDAFLDKLPKGWDYSTEIRNEALLHPRYFEVLKSHNVAHTFNSWTRMPPVAEQMRIVGCETADFISARFLLRPGHSYEQAVKMFQPYKEIKEPNAEAREGLMQALKPERFTGANRRYIYVNNRLEGSPPLTIAAVLLECF